ncbi:MAG TPA: hypothetical protein VFO29_06590 [Candidatus Rubrimentiphilum sp.]|nr:hypothetical protein [Candidatus Rubrimentiphilum sp.]
MIAWLGIAAPKTIALHPSRTIELAVSKDEAFDRCRDGIERVLGGFIRDEERERGTIEAGFGLINSERLTCTVAALDAEHSSVLIEARRGAQAATATPSSYVTALADYLANLPERLT